MEILIASALFTALLVYFITRLRANRNKPVRSTAPQYHWPATGRYEVEITSESRYQAAIANAIASDSTDELLAALIPEDNPQDPNAIRVEIDGRTVGYLPREYARQFRRRLNRKELTGATTTCRASIQGGGPARNGGRKSHSVWLDLKPFGK